MFVVVSIVGAAGAGFAGMGGGGPARVASDATLGTTTLATVLALAGYDGQRHAGAQRCRLERGDPASPSSRSSCHRIRSTRSHLPRRRGSVQTRRGLHRRHPSYEVYVLEHGASSAQLNTAAPSTASWRRCARPPTAPSASCATCWCGATSGERRSCVPTATSTPTRPRSSRSARTSSAAYFVVSHDRGGKAARGGGGGGLMGEAATRQLHLPLGSACSFTATTSSMASTSPPASASPSSDGKDRAGSARAMPTRGWPPPKRATRTRYFSCRTRRGGATR